MGFETILLETGDGVATVTLNRRESYNALNQAMLGELKSAFKQIDRDTSVRAVLITGSGKGFSSGADLLELGANLDGVEITEILRNGLNTLAQSMRGLEKPIVCAINGVAAGAGASLPLMADFRIASEEASFVFAAFSSIGLVPDAGSTYFLGQLVGVGRALELVLLADAKNRVSAAQALEYGLVNRVVAHDDLLPEAQALAVKLARMATKTVGLTKRAIYRASERSLSDALEYEALLQGVAFKTGDFREGVAAFLEKRSPVFRGE